MGDLDDLYRRNHPRSLPLATETGASSSRRRRTAVEGFNPLCGDEVVVSLLVRTASWPDLKIGGSGCFHQPVVRLR